MLPKYVHTSARFRATCHRPLFAAPDQPNTSGNSKRRILFDIRRCSDVKLLSFVLNTCHIIVIRAVPIHSVISLAQSWQILGWSSSRRSRRCNNGNRRRLCGLLHRSSGRRDATWQRICVAAHPLFRRRLVVPAITDSVVTLHLHDVVLHHLVGHVVQCASSALE